MNSNSPDTPTCLVTGGTSGIGQETVRLLRRRGYCIATCGRNTKRLDEMRLELGEENFVVATDLANVEQAKSLAEQVLRRFGRIDLLVNNAATSPMAPFHDLSGETFEETLNVNIRSPFYLTQIIWRQMMKQGSGVIVNISSLAAVDPFPGFNIYGASKAWFDLITTALKTEGLEYGIRTYSIRAGAVETPMLRRAFPDFPADQCVTTLNVAEKIWECVNNEHESGSHIVVAKQT